jgi:hypothetical protein
VLDNRMKGDQLSCCSFPFLRVRRQY